jgi:hypothetical protein
VDLFKANPDNAHARFSNGRETTVSIRHLAPVGSEVPTENHRELIEHSMSSSSPVLTLQDDSVIAESTSVDIPRVMSEDHWKVLLWIAYADLVTIVGLLRILMIMCANPYVQTVSLDHTVPFILSLLMLFFMPPYSFGILELSILTFFDSILQIIKRG